MRRGRRGRAPQGNTLLSPAGRPPLARARAARAPAADVPVCLDPRPRMMGGIGDILSAPVSLPKFGIVIVHPGVAMPTAPVFAALGLRRGERCPVRPISAAVPDERDALLRWLAAERNDLEAP